MFSVLVFVVVNKFVIFSLLTVFIFVSKNHTDDDSTINILSDTIYTRTKLYMIQDVLFVVIFLLSYAYW